MNNYKSQCATLENEGVNLEDRVSVEGMHKRTVILDIDQVCAAHGAQTAEQRQALKDMITNLPEVLDMNLICFDEINIPEEEFISFEILKGRSSTGRFDYPFLPDIHQMPPLKKTNMPPKDGDLFISGESDLDLSRLEKLYQEGDLVSEFQIVGENSDREPIKHPGIFKVTDLAEDEEEFNRLKTTLARNQDIEEMLGWPAPPMFIEAIPDANILDREVDEVMKQLTALSRQYKVDIYFGTKPALKAALYTLMYGGNKKDLDMSKLDRISVEKAIEMYESKLRKVAIIGGAGLGLGKMAKLLADKYSEEAVCLDSSGTWNLKDFDAVSFTAVKPVRDWEHSKLRRGKGHNKFKRKGKK